MKYRGLSVNYAGMGMDMKIDMGLQVFVSEYEAVSIHFRLPRVLLSWTLALWTRIQAREIQRYCSAPKLPQVKKLEGGH